MCGSTTNSAWEFLKQHDLNATMQALQRAREPAQKADLIRLAYLAIEGGFYMDADDRCITPLPHFLPQDASFIAFQEDYGTLGNNFLGAAPEHPVIVRALELATEALLRGDGDFLWLSTGPGLLTRAFCQILTQEDAAGVSSLRAAIFDMGYVQRHVGIHCPLAYKKSARHWSRSSFARIVSNRPHAQGEGAPADAGLRDAIGAAGAEFDPLAPP